MKKAFLFLILVLITNEVIAQQSFPKEWSFGVNAGATFSKMRFTPSVSQESIQQYSGGITARYITEKSFGIQVELNYSLIGWKDLTDEYNPNEYSRTLGYIELPFLSHIYFDAGKRARFFVNLGPQIGFNIKDDYEYTVANGSEAKEYYTMSVDRKFDYGIVASLGFEFRTGIGSFLLDGRYYFGLSDVFNNKRSDLFQSSANNVIGAKVTYLFRL